MSENEQLQTEEIKAEQVQAEETKPEQVQAEETRPERIQVTKKNLLTGKTKIVEFEQKQFLGIPYKKKIEPKRPWYIEALSWIATFLVAFIIVIPIRFFVFEPVRVDGHSMDDTLANGEILWVDKTRYASGWLSLPWQSDEAKQDAPRFTSAGDPVRFDVVICRYPGRGDTNFVKRLIGLPGDTLSLDQDGILTVNGERFDEPYISSRYRTGYMTPFNEYTVPKKGDRMTVENGAVCVNGTAWRWGTGTLKGQAEDGQKLELKTIKQNGGLLGILFLNGQRIDDLSQVEGKTFFLQSDYYFMMGDHRNNSNDSRAQGPIERNMIIGRASQVLFPFGSWRTVLNGLDWK